MMLISKQCKDVKAMSPINIYIYDKGNIYVKIITV